MLFEHDGTDQFGLGVETRFFDPGIVDRACFELEAVDYDQDGDIDIVVRCEDERYPEEDEHFVEFYANSGDGLFVLDGQLVIEEGFLIFEDIDGDGDTDLLVCDLWSIFVYANDGGGMFDYVSSLDFADLGGTAFRLSSMQFADFDGADGIDVIVDPYSGDSDDFFLFSNSGLGQFAAPALAAQAVLVDSRMLGAADCDQDGDVDLLLEARADFGEPYSLWFRRNNGDGTFGVPEAIQSITDNPAHAQLIDVESDGQPEFFVLGTLEDNEGDGFEYFGFGPNGPVSMGLLATGGRLDSLEEYVVGDTDLDGRWDIHYLTSDKMLLTALDAGGQGVLPWFVPFQSAGNTIGAKFGDMNGDGNTDVVTTQLYIHRMTVLLGQGDGVYLPLSSIYSGVNAHEIAIEDFDLDGDLDVAVRNSNDKVTVRMGRGNGRFNPQSEYGVPFGTDLLSLDFDSDGDTDLIAPEADSDQFYVLTNSGDGTFAEPVCVVPGVQIVDSYRSSVITGPVDSQGSASLIVGLESGGVAILRYSGGQWSVEADVCDVCADESSRLRHPFLIDIDSDGAADLLISGRGKFAYAFGDGEGGFGPFAVFEYDSLAEGFEAEFVFGEDMSHDGNVDLVLSGDDVVHAYLFDEDIGTWVYHDSSFTDRTIEALQDIDQDGDFDLVSGREGLVMVFNRGAEAGFCLPDLNADGSLNFFDVSAFLVAYLDGDLAVDFNDDGELNFFDVTAFIAAFNAGCP